MIFGSGLLQESKWLPRVASWLLANGCSLSWWGGAFQELATDRSRPVLSLSPLMYLSAFSGTGHVGFARHTRLPPHSQQLELLGAYRTNSQFSKKRSHSRNSRINTALARQTDRYPSEWTLFPISTIWLAFCFSLWFPVKFQTAWHNFNPYLKDIFIGMKVACSLSSIRSVVLKNISELYIKSMCVWWGGLFMLGWCL